MVGAEVEFGIGEGFFGEELKERFLDDTVFMMPRFGPRIEEEKED